MKNPIWKPWIAETRSVIATSAKWVFAALILSFLVMANLAAALTIISMIKNVLK